VYHKPAANSNNSNSNSGTRPNATTSTSTATATATSTPSGLPTEPASGSGRGYDRPELTDAFPRAWLFPRVVGVGADGQPVDIYDGRQVRAVGFFCAAERAVGFCLRARSCVVGFGRVWLGWACVVGLGS
jgi:hypothetical protein